MQIYFFDISNHTQFLLHRPLSEARTDRVNLALNEDVARLRTWTCVNIL